MHEDFPTDPWTLAIGAVALLAAVFGWLGGGMLWSVILFALVAVPLLLVEVLGFLVYERVGARET